MTPRSLLAAALLAACACGPTAFAPAPGASAPASLTAAASPEPTTAASPAAAQPSAETPTPTPSPSPVALPRCRAPEGARAAICIPGARLDLDEEISDADAAAITAQVADDLVAVQAEFDWTIRGTANIAVYATTARYAAGLRDSFGYSQATADYLAENSVAFFEPSVRAIAVSWEAVSDRRPIAAIRHELTHFVTLEACAPRCDLVPAWLNEGQARLAEALIPGADWRMMRVRFEAASMVSTNTFLPLTSLWTQAQWNAYGDWAGYYKYQEAARATELLRADIGDRAISRVYARIRAGEDVATAYQRLSGKTFASFTASLQARLTANVPAGPSVSVIAPGADGGGASYLLYGFAPEEKVTLRIRARRVDETQEVAVSPQGAYFGSIDRAYPPGTYTITAASGTSVAAVTVVKRDGRAVRAAPFD